MFKSVLRDGDVRRTHSARITAEKHRLQTVNQRKIALSAFDDKRFIHNDGIATLPFGHCAIVEQAFGNIMHSEPMWGEQERSNSTPPMWGEEERSNSPPPIVDPGFNRTAAIHESDIDSEDLVDFDECSGDSSDSSMNPFIDFEAEESDNERTPHKRAKFE